MTSTKNEQHFDPAPFSLVGYAFLSREAERQPYKWQGIVTGHVAEGVYLVETFDWIVGQSSGFHLVRLQEMLSWRFFGGMEELKDFWECHGKHQQDALTRKVRPSEPMSDQELESAVHSMLEGAIDGVKFKGLVDGGATQ